MEWFPNYNNKTVTTQFRDKKESEGFEDQSQNMIKQQEG